MAGARDVQRLTSKKRTSTYTGAWIVIGAALGMIFGLMLFEEMSLGIAIGVALGIMIGAGIDAQNNRKAKE